MIRIGVAGWDYPDWAGIVYPARPGRGFDRLRFLARYFDAIEINSTFYRLPEAALCRSWARRLGSAGSCRFTAKLFRTLTHGEGAGRPDTPPAGGAARLSDVDIRDASDRFRRGVAPLASEGLLDAVLLQFPHSFHDEPDNRRHVSRLAARLEGLPLVAEFRHRSWDNEDALRFLSRLGVGFCNIDQPAVGATLRPTRHVTSRVAYVRLHGRNAAEWFATGRPAFRRYDYLYPLEELHPWVERIARLHERADRVIIIANNHYRGKGPANALMLKSAVERRRVRAPSDLCDAYPELRSMVEPEPRPPGQGRLL
ncbi:MAG: DUF72 domain-containing protein [Acidobacteriota bacterium]